MHRFQQVDAEKITLVYTLGGSKRDAFFKVVFPGSKRFPKRVAIF